MLDERRKSEPSLYTDNTLQNRSTVMSEEIDKTRINGKVLNKGPYNIVIFTVSPTEQRLRSLWNSKEDFKDRSIFSYTST